MHPSWKEERPCFERQCAFVKGLNLRSVRKQVEFENYVIIVNVVNKRSHSGSLYCTSGVIYFVCMTCVSKIYLIPLPSSTLGCMHFDPHSCHRGGECD